MKGSPSRPLPLSLDEITPGWLTEALGVAHPGVEVTSVEIDHVIHGTASKALLRLTYNDAGLEAGLPPTLCAKGGFREALRRRVWGGLMLETRFYRTVAPQLKINIPRCYFAGIDEENRQAVVLLEDLSARGVAFTGAEPALTPDAVAAMLALQATLHAQWWERPDLHQFDGWQEPMRKYMRWQLRPARWAECLDMRQGADVPAPFRDRDVVESALERLWAADDAAPQTLVHGDPHPGNMYFETDGAPGLLDWQCAMRGSWAHDVTYSIMCSLDVDDRRANESALLAHYLDCLAGAGVEPPTSQRAWLEYRRHVLHGFAMVTPSALDQASEDTTATLAQRCQLAAEDHDILQVLG
jgi:aminoglycoside phosphotransferase (APT) family kinase protein